MASIFKQKYTVAGDNGKRIRKQSKCWYIDYKTAEGTRKRVKAFKDKQATQQLAAKLEKEVELAQAGIVDKYKEHRKRPLAEHLEDFKASLTHKGTTEKHTNLVYSRAKSAIDSCKFVYVHDVSASKVQKDLAERRHEGLGIRSSNFYLQALKQFFNWLVADNRTAENPLAHLKGQNPKTDIRHARRALSADELNRLIINTSQGIKHSGMTAKERTMLYMLAVSTGLRAGELASLTWSSFNLSDPVPSVTVLAAYSKHRRDDIQLLPPETAKQFKKWQENTGEQGNNKVLRSFDKGNAAKMLRKDLEKAEIKYRDESGRVADFHSLRHTFITNIVKGGASPKVAQNLARHSQISLTFDTYTHLSLHDGKAALNELPRLPDLDSPDIESGRAVALKTGTFDMPVDVAYKPAYKKLAKNADFGKNKLALNDTIEGAEMVGGNGLGLNDNPLLEGHLGSPCHHLTAEKRRGRDSNPRYRYMPVRRFSKPLPSATRPPLRVFIHKTLQHFLKIAN